jgi:hypothetical protein
LLEVWKPAFLFLINNLCSEPVENLVHRQEYCPIDAGIKAISTQKTAHQRLPITSPDGMLVQPIEGQLSRKTVFLENRF